MAWRSFVAFVQAAVADVKAQAGPFFKKGHLETSAMVVAAVAYWVSLTVF